MRNWTNSFKLYTPCAEHVLSSLSNILLNITGLLIVYGKKKNFASARDECDL